MSRSAAATASPLLDDPRTKALLACVKELCDTAGRPVSVQEYSKHRKASDPNLAAVTTVYRLFPGGWSEVLDHAGVCENDAEKRKRTSTTDMVAALVYVAQTLSVDVLSSHAYDEFRARSQKKLPSSSVIRKWLHSWEEAVQAAGLEAPRRSGTRRVSPTAVIETLRLAVRDLGEAMTPVDYEEWCLERSADGEDPPRLAQVLQAFPSFELAVRSADVERSDDLHPHALWTSDEARRIARNCVAFLRRPLDEAGYEEIRSKASKPMPSWKTLSQLLEDEQDLI